MAIFGIMEFSAKSVVTNFFQFWVGIIVQNSEKKIDVRFLRKAGYRRTYVQTYVRTDLRTEKLKFIGPFRLAMGVQKGLYTFLHWVI